MNSFSSLSLLIVFHWQISMLCDCRYHRSLESTIGIAVSMRLLQSLIYVVCTINIEQESLATDLSVALTTTWFYITQFIRECVTLLYRSSSLSWHPYCTNYVTLIYTLFSPIIIYYINYIILYEGKTAKRQFDDFCSQCFIIVIFATVTIIIIIIIIVANHDYIAVLWRKE